jgi:hypothetical protein
MYIDTNSVVAVILAVTQLATLALTAWTNRKVHSVAVSVNGMKNDAVKSAELAGFNRGAGTTPPPAP